METDSDRMLIRHDPLYDLKAYDNKVTSAIKSHQGSSFSDF